MNLLLYVQAVKWEEGFVGILWRERRHNALRLSCEGVRQQPHCLPDSIYRAAAAVPTPSSAPSAG